MELAMKIMVTMLLSNLILLMVIAIVALWRS